MTEVLSQTLVEVAIHGRYLIRSDSSKDAVHLLVGFHGYGENAERHLDDLLEIPGLRDYRIAAVQALHPFYNTKTGEVVASWMTKLNRESTIAENIQYVHAVVESLQADLLDSPKLVYLGFSQGVAMAYRAAVAAGYPCSGVIALGGDLPPELTEEQLEQLPPVLIGRGKRDEWYSPEKLESDVARLESSGVTVTSNLFDGGHEWTPEFNRSCTDFLAGLNEST